MYDYRQMTPEQRREIVAMRQSRGFPWHKPPHPGQEPGWYLISAATFEHCPHFSAPNELTALELRLLEALAGIGAACPGWVVLPNHYHLLVHLEKLSTVGKALGRVHGRSSRYVDERDQQPGRQVWYKYFDRQVRSERHYWTCLHYILFNAVKHGYVVNAIDWPWSCYYEVLEQYGEEWIADLKRSYPLYDFGEGWDDM